MRNKKTANGEEQINGKAVASPPNMSMSIDYGGIIASVQADHENYVAKISGKIGKVEGWAFHQFVIRFIKSLERASNTKEPF